MSESPAELKTQLIEAKARIVELESQLSKQNKERYCSIVESQTELICRYTPEFILTYVNPAYSSHFGLTPEKMIGISLLSFIPDEDRPSAVALVRTLTAANPVCISEHRTKMPDGSVRWYEWTDRAILGGNGQIVEYQGVARDITKRKKLETEQAQNTRTIEEIRLFLQSTLDVLASHIAVLAPDGTIIKVNAAWQRFAKDNKASISLTDVGANYLNVCDSAIGPFSQGSALMAEGIRAVINGERDTFYLEYPCNIESSYLWFGTEVTPFNELTPRRVVVAHTDITERVKAQDNFNSLNTILAQSRDLVATADLSGNITYVNAGGAAMLGYPSPEVALNNASISDYYLSDDLQQVLEEYMPIAVQTGEWRGENRVRTCNGELIEVEQTIFALQDREGNLKSYATIMVDITERKRALKALKDSEEKYRSLVESSNSSIAMLDREGVFLFANKIAAQRFHLEPETIVGRNVKELMPHEEVVGRLKVSRKVIDTGQGMVVEIPGTLEGEIHWFHTSVQPVLDPSGTPFAVLINSTDITNLKQAETARRESEELLQELMRHLPGTVFIFDQKNTLLFCNELYAKSLGYTPEEILGKELKAYLPPEIYAKALQENELVLSQKKVMEFSFKNANSQHWLIIKFPIPRQGLPPHLGAIGLDVTREKEAEEILQKAHDILEQRVIERTAELRHNQADLESIIESTSLAFVLYDLDGKARLSNKLAKEYQQRYFGSLIVVGEDEVDSKPIEVQPILPEHFARVKSGEQLIIETPIKDGDKTIYFEFRYYPVKAAGGEILGVSLAFEDVTVRKESELQLRYLANLQEYMLEAVSASDLQFNIKSWNKAAEKIYGWTAEEAIGKNVVELVPSVLVSGETEEEAMQIILEKGVWSGETIQRRRDGSQVNILSSMVLFKDAEGNPTGLVAVGHDITGRKRAEAGLEEKRQQELELQGYLKALHEISVELTSISKLDEFYKKVVQFGLERLGFERLGFFLYDPETRLAIGTYGTDVQGRLVAEHDLKFDPTAYTGIMKQAMHDSDRYIYAEEARLFSNGEFIGLGWNAAVSLWQGSELLGWLTIDNGISHKPIPRYTLEVLSLYRMTVAVLLANKRVEEKLQSTSQRLGLATKTGGIGIWELNLIDGTLIWDDQMLALYGITREYFTGTNEVFQKAVHPDDWDRLRVEVEAAISRERPFDLEFRIYWPNGSLHHIKSNAIILRDENDRPIREIGVNWDITNLKRSEETLRDALKKEKELGELKSSFVSRASHEFRTPLAAILATTESLSIYRDKMSSAQMDIRLDKIRQQIMYLKGIMEDVLELSRIQSGKLEFRPSQGNIDELCQNIITEFESQVKNKNRIIYNTTNSPLFTAFDSRLIRQVISNLTSNALKYSPAEKPVYLNLSENESHVMLKVRDEGIGIPPEDMKSLFEPFQRASNVGTIAGTGLGLSIALQAVEMHQGTISVESELSIGTTFTLAIPKNTVKRKEND